MKRCRLIPTLAMTVMTTLPIGNAWGTVHASALTTVTHRLTAAKAKKYRGPLVAMRWGPVQATITVKSRKITNVKISTLPENFRSRFIDQQAIPLLKQETLQSQSAAINTVSGATMTSDAYIQSLQAALQVAHF